MKRWIVYILPFILLACQPRHAQTYRVGLSINNEGPWQEKLCNELQYEALHHPQLELLWAFSGGDVELQAAQIDSLVNIEHIDVLIITDEGQPCVQASVNRVFDAGVPVITTCRGDSTHYTAFVGADNNCVGAQMAKCLIDYANEKNYSAQHPLYAIEVQGAASRESVVQRHQGLLDSVAVHPEVVILGSGFGNWTHDGAYTITDSLLKLYPQTEAIVAHSDFMAVAAYEAGKAAKPDTDFFILGVDALAATDGGLEHILSGEIDASIANYSRGDVMITTALAILRHQPYERDNMVDPIVVDCSSPQLIKRMLHELATEQKAMQAVQLKMDQMWQRSREMRTNITALISCMVLMTFLFVVILLFFRYRMNIKKERAEHDAAMAKQQQQLDQMYEELERVKEDNTDEAFMQRLKQTIEKHLEEADLSVEAISREMGVSRTNLYRKTVAVAGITPTDLVREIRMRKAQQLLLHTSLTVQQIAYSVGISSASYFTKCYKAYFGKNPTDEPRKY